MPRKPRINLPGHYHIINRGVEKRVVFGDSDDYTYFIELLCALAKQYGVTLHNYCLMRNHYHLLIETSQNNLSSFMKQLNGNYAIYFNKKHQRSGHLWQGRYQSWYVTDDAYLYALILYIEHNPVKANIVDRVEEYPYSTAHLFLSPKTIPEYLHNSWIVQNYRGDAEAIKAFLDSSVDTGQLAELKKASSLLEAPNSEIKPDEDALRNMLNNARDTKERNTLIVAAYKEGYSQHMIAKVVGISQPAVCGIIKRGRQ